MFFISFVFAISNSYVVYVYIIIFLYFHKNIKIIFGKTVPGTTPAHIALVGRLKQPQKKKGNEMGKNASFETIYTKILTYCAVGA
jgi:hypothetical protein